MYRGPIEDSVDSSMSSSLNYNNEKKTKSILELSRMVPSRMNNSVRAGFGGNFLHNNLNMSLNQSMGSQGYN